MKEYVSGDGMHYLFSGTVQELRDLVRERKENVRI